MKKICVIVPCFNEERRLNIEDFIEFQNLNSDFHLCFVNDGSLDNTKIILKNITTKATETSFLSLKNNVGKAEAIRFAIMQKCNDYNWFAYIDADLSTPLSELKRLYHIMLFEKKKMVVASRVKILGASIKRKAYRHIFGRMIATFVDKFILQLEIYDTQCGAKIFDAQLAKELFKEPFKSNWLFDVELFARAKKKYGIRFCKELILEIPLKQWHDTRDSRITFWDVLETPFALIKLYLHYIKK